MASKWALQDAFRPGILALRRFYRVFLFFQAIAVALYIAYDRIPAVQTSCDAFASWKKTGGIPLSASLTAIAGTLLPELARLLVGPDRTFGWSHLKRLGCNFLFFAFTGVMVDLFYMLQAFFFGIGPSWKVVAPKMLMDFFVFVPWVALPLSVSYFLWLELGWSPRRVLRAWSWTLYRDRVLPLMIPDFAYWGPILVFLYGLPLTLQVPFFLLAFSGWSLAFVFIGSHGLERKA